MTRSNGKRLPWTTSKVTRFWATRRSHSVLKDMHRNSNISNAAILKYLLQKRHQDNYERFLSEEIRGQEVSRDDLSWPYEKAPHLEYWCMNGSWTFCPDCKVLSANKLLNSFEKRIPKVKATSCHCSKTTWWKSKGLIVHISLKVKLRSCLGMSL